MKKFKFRFQAVEELRIRKEEEAMRAFAEAQELFRAEVGRRNELLGQLEGSMLRRESLANEPTLPANFALEEGFIAGTKQRIIQQEQAIYRAARRVRKAHQEFLAARRERMVIEKLRERELEEYKKAAAKKEQKELDELYVTRAGMPKEIA